MLDDQADVDDPGRSIPLAWLDEPKERRGTLLVIHGAVSRGWFAGPENAGRLAELVDRLRRLAAEDITPRERRRVVRIFQALDRAGSRPVGLS